MRTRLYRLLGRHDDGTRHSWVGTIDPGEHWCEWDYCRCFAQICTVCGRIRVVSAGSEEMR